MEEKALSLLILDDNPDDAELAVKQLEQEGFDVKSSRVDTEEGFRKALAERPDLILAYYKLPFFDCMAALQIQQRIAPEIPLIIFSGTIGEEVAVECTKSGATDYVFKDRLFRLGPAVKRAVEEAEAYRERKRAEEALKEAHDELEIQVQKRTDELSTANDQLKQQIEARKRAEKSLLEAKERFRTIVETAPSLLTITDEEGNNLYVSPNCKKITGYTQEELQGRVIWWVHEDDTPAAKEFFERTFRLGVGGKDFEYKAVRKNGEVWYASSSWEPFRDEQDKFLGIVFQTADITERKKTEEKVKYLSFHDFLTGLYNRAFFEEEMKRLNTVRKYPVGIIMADIDKLKFINDAFGHAEGDELLKRMANILVSATRKEDVVARTGGDEFAIILPNVDEETTQSLYNRIIDACKDSNREASLRLTVSLGYSIQYGQYEDMQEALRAADDHMYGNKLVSSKAVRGNVIDTLIFMLAERDIHREKHSKQLQKIALSLGKDKGLSEHRLEELRLLVILYDIGKIGIPDSILNKPENLTSEEWEGMKKHCAIGHRIARNIPELVPVAKDILCHHEWWNGKGYPRGLKGEEIPLLARIISIMDAYNAMLSQRSYKKTMSKEEAMKEIKKGAGTQFDPELAERFLKIVRVRDKDKIEDPKSS